MTPVVQAAGWTLVHFVWQGALIAISSAIVLELLAFRSARTRYAVACLSLAAMLAAPIATLGMMTSSSSRPAPITLAGDGARLAAGAFRVRPMSDLRGLASPVVFDPVSIGRLDVNKVLTAIVACWLAGVVCLLVRMTGGWWRVRRLHRLVLASPSSRWQPACERLAANIGLRRLIHVVESTLVDVPSVVGWLQPVIVLPIASLAGLAPAQVEAILAHELAHIRRHDYVINLLQTLAETLLFYHPAVWWVSARVRAEREYCCDDVALELSGDAMGYATALAELESRRSIGRSIVMAANGGSLVDRVGRILRVPSHDSPRSPGWIVTIVFTALFTASAGVVQWLPTKVAGTTARAAAPPPGQSVPSVYTMPADDDTLHLMSRGDEYRFRWSEGLSFQDVRGQGDLLFTDELTDVRALANGGYLLVREWTGWLPRSVEIRASGGVLTHKYYVAGFEKSWSAEAEQWLAVRLPRLVRRSGLGAPARVRQILAARGVDGVLAEINLLDGDYARHLYVGELLKATGPLDGAATVRLLTMAATLVRSDYYLAELLRDAAPLAAGDALASKAYLAAADRINSDYEHRRALVALLKTDRQSPATAELAVESAGNIRSDYERAETLRVAVQQGYLGQGDAFFSAVSHMESDYEKRRVLSTVLVEQGHDLELEKGLLAAAATIGSDYECAELLLDFNKRFGVDPTTRDPFFAAVGTIDSSYELRRVLSEVLKKDVMGRDIVQEVIGAASTMSSDYERAELLLSVLQHQPIDFATRELMIDAVDKMGSSYEQGRVLVALVRAERR